MHRVPSTSAYHPHITSLSRMELKEWMSVHDSLSRTVRKAAKVALGKDVSKVQHFIMSGKDTTELAVVGDVVDICLDQLACKKAAMQSSL